MGTPLEASWEELAAILIEPHYPKHIRDELRTSFFCGAYFVLMLTEIQEDAPAEGLKVRYAGLNMVHDELEAFYKDFQRRAAAMN